MIIVGSDHAGFNLKNKLIEYLSSKHIEVKDVGCFNQYPIDYPLIGYQLASEVVKNNCFGIGVCGSGIGISMACNKIKGARAVNCNNIDLALLSRKHNDANIICFGERLVNYKDAIKYLDAFLNEEFEGGRHINRVNELNSEGDEYEG